MCTPVRPGSVAHQAAGHWTSPCPPRCPPRSSPPPAASPRPARSRTGRGPSRIPSAPQNQGRAHCRRYSPVAARSNGTRRGTPPTGTAPADAGCCAARRASSPSRARAGCPSPHRPPRVGQAVFLGMQIQHTYLLADLLVDAVLGLLPQRALVDQPDNQPGSSKCLCHGSSVRFSRMVLTTCANTSRPTTSSVRKVALLGRPR